MLNNEELVEILESYVSNAKGNRIQKILKSPMKMIFLKMMEEVSLGLKKSIKWKVKTFWGETMFVIIPETVSLHICRYGFFEEDLTRMVLEYLKPGMTFFDIGAHFGYYTLLASFIVGEKGGVHAFEPTPSSFAILKANTLNKHNVVLNNLAVFSEKGNVTINDYGVRYSAFNSIYDRRKWNLLKKLTPRKYKTETITIDEYVEEHKISPSFIKIDAENSEFEILKGMRKTIAIYHPIISVEVGDQVGDLSKEGVPSSRELITQIIDYGYTPYEYKDKKFVKHALKNLYTYGNILFLPTHN